MPKLDIHHGDNLEVLRSFDDASFDLIYIDPPFNTGKAQSRTTLRTVADPDGDRTGFGGKRYRTEELGQHSYPDDYDDYLGFLAPRLAEAKRLLTPRGSLFVHLDYREVHYIKVHLDGLFGREHFVNEIVWAYDYGARTKKRWAPKHDNILWYVADPRHYTYDREASDRIPYMAPKLVGAEKAERGKVPTDVWWHTIVSPTSKEKTGYPSQKPIGLLRRIVAVHSEPGQRLLDFFAGSGSFGEAAIREGRDCVLIDQNPEAIEVMQQRFADQDVTWHGVDVPRRIPPASSAPGG